jgi:hypothetical protein
MNAGAGLNPSVPVTEREVKGQWEDVRVRNPESVCCDVALMVCALRSVGVGLHPQFAFYAWREEIAGETVTMWRWVLAAKSSDGLYKTADLMKWWRDPAWGKANPKHEFAIVCAAMRNMGVQASEVRAQVPRVVVRRGEMEAHIPVNASPARRAHLLGKLEGKVAMNARFVEPASGDTGTRGRGEGETA